MWTEACALLDRAERLNRRFFEPGETSAWSPPVDIFETDTEVWILAALPGVEPRNLAVHVEGDTLVLSGHRPLPAAARTPPGRLAPWPTWRRSKLADSM